MAERPPVIDAWAQHPTGAFMRHPMFASLLRWMGADPEKLPPEIPHGLTVGAMEMAGVTRAIVCAWHGPQGALIPNEAVDALCKERPDLFAGLASVDISQPMQAARDLRYWVKERGMKGLRLLPWLWRLPPNHRWYYPVLAECCELGVPFCLQVGHAGPLMPSEPGRPIPYLDEVAVDFPDLTIVGGHIGYPWTVEMIAMATKYPNVYIDTSAYKPKRYPPELVAFMKGHGKKKVLFGSNFPMIQPGDCLKQVPDLGLDEETQRLFLHDNAARTFGL